MDPADVLGISDREGDKRVLAAVAILASVVTALLSGLQIHLGNEEQRANLLAARHIVQLSATISSSGSLATFATQSKLTATDLEIRGLARRYVAVGAGAAGDVELNRPVAGTCDTSTMPPIGPTDPEWGTSHGTPTYAHRPGNGRETR